MQNVKFNSLVEFFDFLPENERIITHVLRDLVLECLPNCKEKLSFQVPFYSINKTVCFIWPGSVLWGKKRMYDGVRMGFTTAHLIDPQEEFLRLDHRKSVGYIDISSPDEIEPEMIRSLLIKALDQDARDRKTKR